MYFRQFLNDESACASYLLGHTDQAERALRAERCLSRRADPARRCSSGCLPANETTSSEHQQKSTALAVAEQHGVPASGDQLSDA